MLDLFTLENFIALITLTSLEMVLGIDNIVIIAILAGKLPGHRRALARQVGLSLAMLLRILLLLSVSFILRWTAPLFTLFGHAVSGHDLILLIGGLFLIAKATYEIHHTLEAPGGGAEDKAVRQAASFFGVIAMILALDLVFSIDSVITAIGMTDVLAVMIAAIVIAVTMMLIFSGPLAVFIEHHPTIKMLALSFMLLIGVMLLVEGTGHHVDKGYIYAAMGFSLVVELLNLKLLSHRQRRRAAAEAG